MFSSLRSRLWLTYALSIVTALLVVAIIFVIYLIGNPLIYRQTRLRLTVVQATMRASQADWSNLPPKQLQTFMTTQAQELDVRLLVINAKRKLLVDSQTDSPAIQFRAIYRQLRLNQTLNDAQGQPWLYVSRKLDNGNLLLTAVPRPKVSIWNVFTDELMPPLLWGGGLALILALMLAYWMARWVADPLQHLVTAAQEFSGGSASLLKLHGPQEVREVVGAFNQMTERVRAGQQAQRDFVANVSHELKTPLTSIQGFSQAILDGTASTPDEQKQSAQVIHTEAARMHRLVLDLLDLARLDAGIADLKHERVDLAVLLNSISERFSPQARLASVQLQVHSPALPALVGDGDRLAQVFTNLVDNSLKFTPPGGKISIDALPVGAGIEITFSDSGSGIPPESLPHIFERFYQADSSRQGGSKHGTGLGLTIAQEIVHAHSGKITVRSLPGQGSSFIVWLPLDDQHPLTPQRKTKK